MVQHSLLEAEEIDRERTVVQQEIKRAHDNPGSFVGELLPERAQHQVVEPLAGQRLGAHLLVKLERVFDLPPEDGVVVVGRRGIDGNKFELIRDRTG